MVIIRNLENILCDKYGISYDLKTIEQKDNNRSISIR